MRFKIDRTQFDTLRNDIGNITHLNSVLASKLKIQMGINQAMTQSLISLGDQEIPLWDFEFRVFSQWGEDGIINYILNKTNIAKPNCLEIGVEDFTECNTRFLAEYRSSNLYLVDSSPAAADTIAALDLAWKSTIHFENNHVTIENINDIIRRANKKLGKLDLFSLDIDGVDYWILNEIEFMDFEIVILEYNSYFGPDLLVTVPYKENFARSDAHYSYQFYGASLSAYIELMANKGYFFLGSNRANTNAFFVKEKYQGDFKHIKTFERSAHTLLNVRDSRNISGDLDFRPQLEIRELLSHLEVFDISNNRLAVLGDLQGPNSP